MSMKKTHIPIYHYLKQQHQKTGLSRFFRVPVPPKIVKKTLGLPRVAARVVAKRMKVRTQVTKAKARARPLNSPGGLMKLFTKQLPGGWLIRDDANDKKSLFF